MPAENFSNFASALLTSEVSTNAPSLTVQSGLGSLFPSNNFVVTIDTELLFITQRTGDTFVPGIRGFNGSIVSVHHIGATVELAACAYNFQHLWQNVADTFNPLVPPAQRALAANTYDTEFDTPGGMWMLYSGGGNSIFAIGASLASHLLLARAQGDNTLYTAYTPFSLTGAYTITCKVSDSTSFLASTSDQAQVQLFVCDQSSPVSGPDTGNRFRLTLFSTSDPTNARFVRAGYATSGVNSFLVPTVSLPLATSVYLRLTYNGAGVWTAYIGDGVTYTLLGTKSGLTFTSACLGLQFNAYNPSHGWVPQVAAVDFVRVVTSVLPPYGN